MMNSLVFAAGIISLHWYTSCVVLALYHCSCRCYRFMYQCGPLCLGPPLMGQCASALCNFSLSYCPFFPFSLLPTLSFSLSLLSFSLSLPHSFSISLSLSLFSTINVIIHLSLSSSTTLNMTPHTGGVLFGST